jgi:hypothetical protein
MRCDAGEGWLGWGMLLNNNVQKELVSVWCIKVCQWMKPAGLSVCLSLVSVCVSDVGRCSSRISPLK